MPNFIEITQKLTLSLQKLKGILFITIQCNNTSILYIKAYEIFFTLNSCLKAKKIFSYILVIAILMINIINQLNWKDESMRSCGVCTDMGLWTQPLILNLCWLQAIAHCLEICKSVNIALIIYSFHARTIFLHFDPLVTSLYFLPAIISCIWHSIVVRCLFNFLTAWYVFF